VRLHQEFQLAGAEQLAELHGFVSSGLSRRCHEQGGQITME
jgi:hypothetical protein